jgi:hypothetical protein
MKGLAIESARFLAEFRNSGVNVTDVPTVKERLENWDWQVKNHGYFGAYHVAEEFAQYLRRLAERIDNQGKLVH